MFEKSKWNNGEKLFLEFRKIIIRNRIEKLLLELFRTFF